MSISHWGLSNLSVDQRMLDLDLTIATRTRKLSLCNTTDKKEKARQHLGSNKKSNTADSGSKRQLQWY